MCNIPSNDFQYLKLQKSSPLLRVYQSSLEKTLIAIRSSRTEWAFSFWSLLLQVWARQRKNIIKVENTDSDGLWLKQNGLWSQGSRLSLRVYLLAIFIQKIANISSTDSPKLIILSTSLRVGLLCAVVSSCLELWAEHWYLQLRCSEIPSQPSGLGTKGTWTNAICR